VWVRQVENLPYGLFDERDVITHPLFVELLTNAWLMGEWKDDAFEMVLVWTKRPERAYLT